MNSDSFITHERIIVLYNNNNPCAIFAQGLLFKFLERYQILIQSLQG